MIKYRHFDMEDPPMPAHPNCRCTIFDDNTELDMTLMGVNKGVPIYEFIGNMDGWESLE